MELKASEIIERVIGYTIEHAQERDPWEKSPAISAILAWNNPIAVKKVRRWIDRAVATQSTAGYLCYPERLEASAGHVRVFTPTASLSASLGVPLLEFYERTKEERYIEAARQQVDAIGRVPRTRDGGISARFEAIELWIDFTYLMCPFLARFGRITGETRHLDEAFAQFEIHAKHLVDPLTGLARHAWCETPNHYLQSTFWARGNGWLTTCAVDLIDIAPDHKSAPAVREVCRRALHAVREYQDRSGYLCNTLDEPFSKFESSGTAMFAYSMAKAARQGIVDQALVDDAMRAWNVVAGSVEETGAIPGVALPPGGPGVPFGTALFGQGFFLLAGYELRGRLGIGA
jgi:unsaturated rhamnogalacturonyl hydrolase